MIVLLACLMAGCVAREGAQSGAPANQTSQVVEAAPHYAVAEKPAAFPYGVNALAACVLEGRVYVAGGYGNRGNGRDATMLRQLWRYDPEANEWQRLADMPEGRCFHAMATARGNLYIFGGIGEGRGAGSETREAVLMYDPRTNRWSEIGRLPTPRNRLAAAAVGDRVYVVAGMQLREHLENTETVDILDARTHQWSRGAPLPSAGHGVALAVVGHTLVLAGGTGDMSETWLYDTTSDKWRKGSAMPEYRLFASAAAVGGIVHVIGNRANAPIPLLVYDLAADKWQQAAAESVDTHRAAAVTLHRLIYVIGGEGPRGREISRVSRYDPATGAWAHSD